MKLLSTSLRTLLLAVPCLLMVDAAYAGDPPRSMRHLVLNPKHRQAQPLQLGGSAWEAFQISSDLPRLAWPAQGTSVNVERDREAVRKFLEANAKPLGIEGFQVVFDHNGRWRLNEVWSYRLERDGLELFDARIDVHWDGERFVGLFNLITGPVVKVETLGERDGAHVWFSRPTTAGPRGAIELILAQDISVEQAGQRQRQLVATNGTTLTTIVAPPVPPVGAGTQASVGTATHTVAVWTEFPVPSGSFPDQISSDSTGKIWFSQPNNSKVTALDPSTGTFSSVNTPGDVPDGLSVDSNDLVWSGSYASNRGLVRVDALTGMVTVYPPPYASALMAIPLQASSGRIWVTDHQLNRISEFNPTNGTWVNSYPLPNASAWVVDPTEDTSTRVLYFTEYNINGLLRRAPGQAPTHVALPTSGGPAFNRYSNGKVYVSLWSSDRLGVYDIASGSFTQYSYPISGESGGPLDLMSDGRVAIGTRNVGYVMLFNPQTQTFRSYKIPTSSPGLKDGLHVDAMDNIWVTETTSGNKLARLEL